MRPAPLTPIVLLNRSEVCLITSDFWGLPGAGGTATAYHQLASLLANSSYSSSWPVTILAATSNQSMCSEARQKSKADHVRFECLEERHLLPNVVANTPYEDIGIAVVRWLHDTGQHCDVVHTHEWGGEMHQLAAHVNFRHKPGVRLIVEAHGGHHWSTQGARGSVPDLFTLRVDHQEGLTLQLADEVISPSKYMLAHLRQRGIQMLHSEVIPNIMPQHALQLSGAVRMKMKVWRLAFFSRLDVRKGLKTFCDVVESLNFAEFPTLEVLFVGGIASVDTVPSDVYLRERTQAWPVPVSIFTNSSREAALAILKQAGTLVVFTSIVENSPFALAEASIEGIPFLSFCVGGIPEMLDQVDQADTFFPHPTTESACDHVRNVLSRGWMLTTVLRQSAVQGAAQWRGWHESYDLSYRARVQQDIERRRPSQHRVLVYQVKQHHGAQMLKHNICGNHRTSAILLLPDEFQLPSPASETQLNFLASHLARLHQERKLSAFVFGTELEDSSLSFPSGPTWTIYDPRNLMCSDSVPLLIQREVLCSMFLPEAGDFENYHSWLLIHHLKVAGLLTVPVFQPVFPVISLANSGSSCNANQIPHFRYLSVDRTANLMGSSEEVLMAQHLAVWPQPKASFRRDFAEFQGQLGWSYLTRTAQGKMILWDMDCSLT